jgi:PPP family 3-phenylpropionic acid transporter
MICAIVCFQVLWSFGDTQAAEGGMSNQLIARRGRASSEHQGDGARLWVAKLYYLSFYAAIGALAPFFNIFLLQRGLSGAEIGLIGSLPPLISLAANPFWGSVADRWQIHQKVLALCVFVAGAVTFAFIWVSGFWPLLFLVMLMIFFRTPVPALVDTAVMGMIARTGASYGRQRLFGSIGFLVVSLGLGSLLTVDDLDAIFWVHGGLLIFGCTFLSFLLPMERHSGAQANLLAGLRVLAGQRRYMSFILMNVLFGFGAACFVNFIGLRLLALGGSEAQVGQAFALNALTEIPIMFVGARLMARFSLAQLMVTGMIGLGIAYMLGGLAGSPALIMVAMVIIGFAGGAFWMAVVAYANETAPPGLRATGQSLVGAAQGGLGWALGSITGGLLWDSWGGTVVLLVAGISMFVGAIVFGIGQRTGAPPAIVYDSTSDA